jgi:acyl-CoA synthetase (AMP-forming)/AMP-acid ligase II
MALVSAAQVASGRGEEPALVDGDREITWRELDGILNRATNALLSLAERAQDRGGPRRIAVFARNAVEVVAVHFAAHLAGVSSVPVSSFLGVDELAYILEDSGASALFCGPETVDVATAAAARVPGVDRVVAWRSPDYDGVLAFDAWLAGAPDLEPTTMQAPELALLYTSGTTGRPKGTNIRTQPPVLPSVAEWIPALGGGLVGAGKPHLVVGPFHHTGPFVAIRYLASGSLVVVLQRFDAEQLLALADRYRCASTLMVPTHFTRLLALPDEVRARYDVSAFEWVAHTGAATPADVKRAMIEWFGPVLSEAYGASESGTVCSISSPEWLAHPGSVGKCTPGFVVHVVDEEGNDVGPNVEGRLFFEDRTGRGIVYHNDPAKSASVHLRPGVFTIGEVGYVDADGYVFITDRTSDMVISGGVNIYPAEAEQVLVTHPAVHDCAGIGVPNDDLGEELKMLVELRDGAEPAPSDEELIEWCRERLAHYKCPRTAEIVPSVGRTVMGKLNKRELRRPYWPTERTIG